MCSPCYCVFGCPLGEEMKLNPFWFKSSPALWLDVKDFNHRARTLYASEGFVVEGTLRECLKADDGSFESLVVMSLLKREYQAGAY
jgi:diamine N-acetyltransferase